MDLAGEAPPASAKRLGVAPAAATPPATGSDPIRSVVQAGFLSCPWSERSSSFLCRTGPGAARFSGVRSPAFRRQGGRGNFQDRLKAGLRTARRQSPAARKYYRTRGGGAPPQRGLSPIAVDPCRGLVDQRAELPGRVVGRAMSTDSAALRLPTPSRPGAAGRTDAIWARKLPCPR